MGRCVCRERFRVRDSRLKSSSSDSWSAHTDAHMAVLISLVAGPVSCSVVEVVVFVFAGLWSYVSGRESRTGWLAGGISLFLCWLSSRSEAFYVSVAVP